MAHMLPFPVESFTTPSEEKVYNLLKEQLSDEYTVFYGRTWRVNQQDVEADFIIAKLGGGIVVLEVKGGIWERQGGTWHAYSNPQTGRDDPFQQVRSIRGNLVDLLRGQQGWRDTFYPVTTAVALPDTDYRSGTQYSDLPTLILHKDLRYLDTILEDMMNDCVLKMAPGIVNLRLLDHLKNSLMRDYVMRISDILKIDDERLHLFTEQQLKLDKSLRRMKRITTQGCAGSGKTLLAIRQVRQLASRPEVKRILFTCFNKELGLWLVQQTKDLEAVCLTMPILEFFNACTDSAGLTDGSEEKDQEYYNKLPLLFLEANSLPEINYKFDAIVVDEGQSFKPEWWEVLESLLVDKQKSHFYIFYDDLQRIYEEAKYPVPGEDEAYELTVNLRNTARIHHHSTKYLPQEKLPDCNSVEGDPVWVHTYTDKDSQVKALRKVLRLLITDGGVSIKDIVLLTPKSSRSAFQPEMKIGNYVISKVESESPNVLRMTTIQAFRGMERKVVILAELDRDVEHLETLNYLGSSRARTKLVLLVSADLDAGLSASLTKGCMDITALA